MVNYKPKNYQLAKTLLLKISMFYNSIELLILPKMLVLWCFVLPSLFLT